MMREIFLKFIGIIRPLVPSVLVDLTYKSQLISKPLRTFLNSIVAQTVTNVTVVGGPIRGLALGLDLRKEKYYWLGTHEPMLEKAIRDFTRSGMVAYDIGAHIGYWSLCFARIVGLTGSVLAIEPFPPNFRRLDANIALNLFSNVIFPISVAVSDKDGDEFFLVDEKNSMGRLANSSHKNPSYTGEMELPTRTLDSLIYKDKKPRPDIIKMDIEGGEVRAIIGMERILHEVRPICLFELHGTDAIAIVLSTLWRHKYDVHRMGSEFARILNIKEMNFKEHIVAIPKH